MSLPVTKEEWDCYYAKVYGFFYRRVNIRFVVEELTAETLNAFFLTFREVDNRHAFLWGIARNKLKDYIKSKKIPGTVPLDENTATEDSYSEYYADRMEKLINCIKKFLKPEDVEIVEQCIMCDFSSYQVARSMNMKPVTVRQRLRRGLELVRKKCAKLWFS